MTKIKPTYVKLTNNENFERSKIVIHITANIEDYLIKKDTKKIVEEKKVFKKKLIFGQWSMPKINGY